MCQQSPVIESEDFVRRVAILFRRYFSRSGSGVPRPCAFCKACPEPVEGGGYDAARTMRCCACRFARHLRLASSALCHLLLLPEIALSEFRTSARPIFIHPGRNAPALPLRRSRIRSHARAYSSADQRTASHNSIHRDASAQTAVSTRPAATAKAPRPATTCAPWRRTKARILASAVLRLQCMDHNQAGGETALHAPQSSETRIGGFS